MGNTIFTKIKKDLGPLGSIAHLTHHFLTYPKLVGDVGPYMKYQNRTLLNWSINNYLGLSNHPEVRQADADAARDYGLGYPMGSRMMSANTDYHELFEKQLADFVGSEDSFLMNFGYQGVMSAIETLVDHKDVIVFDSECHACLIDGIRLHKAKGGIYYKYLHNNMESLEKNLIRASKYVNQTGGGILVITEGVFGMTGELGKLNEIVNFKNKFEFKLLVDDAHGFGVMGKNGKGTGEYFDCQNQIDLYFATFTKAMSSMGAFIGADSEVINYLKYNSRSQIFAKALPIGYVIGGIKRLELIKENPQFRTKLWHIASMLQKGLKEKGFNMGNTNTHVCPVLLNQEFTHNEALNLINDLRENMNIFCSVVIYPVVPKDILMLRLIPTSMHSEEDVNYTVDCFEIVRNRLFNGEYRFPFKHEKNLN
jgi:glycine C-acetyltransferase